MPAKKTHDRRRRKSPIRTVGHIRTAHILPALCLIRRMKTYSSENYHYDGPIKNEIKSEIDHKVFDLKKKRFATLTKSNNHFCALLFVLFSGILSSAQKQTILF